MKKILQQLKGHKTLIFLDLEGTQFSHEMIACGAVRVAIDAQGRIRKKDRGIRFYVKAKHPIGHFVEHLTGIDRIRLDCEGLSYKKAMQKLRHYCGVHLNNVMFVTFGSHDLRIIMKSLEASPDANADFCHYICKHCLDLSAFVGQYVRDEHNNPLSLLNYLKVFEVAMIGEPHDPLIDAQHLVLLYEAILTRSDILYQEYLQTLRRLPLLPEPIKRIVNDLLDGQNVSPEAFQQYIKEYLA